MKINNSTHIYSKAASLIGGGFSLLCLTLVIATLISPARSLAQEYRPSKLIYDKDSLRADLKDLKELIFETHQNPFLYADSATFESAYTEAVKAVSEDISALDFAEIVSKFLSVMKDSHTGVSYQSLFSHLQSKTALNLYFRVELIDDKIVVAKDYLELIPIGAELLSVNGVSIEQIRKELEPYKFQEGNSEYSRERISAGYIMRAFSARHDINASNLIEYSSNDYISSVKYPGTPFKTIRKDYKKRKSTPIYDLQIEDSIAFLKVGSFSAGSQSQYDKFLTKSFKKINRNKCTSVVIDLRNNLGGSVWRMEQLFTYLNGKDVIAPHNMILKKSEFSNLRYKRLTRGVSGWVRMNMFRKSDKMRVFREAASIPVGTTDTLFYKTITPKSKFVFDGNSFLFINHASGSASVLFASYFDKFNFGTIYGTPCLGPKGGTWGDTTPYTMPRSRLRINMAVIRLNTEPEVSSDPTNIEPDVFYEKSLEDLISGDDGLKQMFILDRVSQ